MGHVDLGRLETIKIDVAGVGSVGRPLALMLGALRPKFLQLWDPDVVSVENIPTQCWRPADLGARKVDAVKRHFFTPQGEFPILVSAINFEVDTLPNVLFAAVDTMEGRRYISGGLKLPDAAGTHLFVDCRIGNESFQVFAVQTAKELESYKETLFDDAMGQGVCATHGQSYTAQMAACVAMRHFIHWLNGDCGGIPFMVGMNLADVGILEMEPPRKEVTDGNDGGQPTETHTGETIPTTDEPIPF